MKTKFIILSAITACLFFTSCSDDMESKSVKPTFSGMTITPNSCYPGDEITATVNYNNKGAFFYFYSQVITLDDSIVYKSEAHTTDLPTNVKIIAPKHPGKHVLQYSAKVSYTSGTKLFDVTDDVKETFQVLYK